MKVPNLVYHGPRWGYSFRLRMLGPGTGASAETGAVALAFISHKRGTVLAR
jgi:hypothetical protein